METDPECEVSMDTNSLLQHLFLKIFYRSVLLARQFRFVMNRASYGVRWPGPLIPALGDPRHPTLSKSSAQGSRLRSERAAVW